MELWLNAVLNAWLLRCALLLNWKLKGEKMKNSSPLRQFPDSACLALLGTVQRGVVFEMSG